jgi:hypothetical protein
MASTKDIVDHHLNCFGAGDLNGVLSDYAPNAVLFTPDGPLRGVSTRSSRFSRRSLRSLENPEPRST